MQTPGKAGRWLMDERYLYRTDPRTQYLTEQRTITLTADELIVLLGHAPRVPAKGDQDGDHGKGDHDGGNHDHGGRVDTAIQLHIDDKEALKRDFSDLDESAQRVGAGLKNMMIYGAQFGEALRLAESDASVDCGKLMAPYRQCGAWVMEVMKDMAKVQCALARVGGHVGFTHACPAPPCVAPTLPDPKGSLAKAPQARVQKRAQNDRPVSPG